MTTYYRLEQQIIDWHNARNLIEGSTDTNSSRSC